MIEVEQMMSIKILHSQGLSQRKIAKELGISRNTVRKYLEETSTEPCYQPRPNKPKKLEPYYEYLKTRIAAAHPAWLPATVLFEEIKALGYEGQIRILRYYLHSLKTSTTPEPVVRFETAPGKQMQVDWAEFRKGKDRLSAFIATLGFSRMAYVEFVTDEKINTLLNCLQNAFEFFEGVTQEVLFDNMKTVVIKRDCYGTGFHRFQSQLWDFAKHYGFIPKLCAPYRAQTKGKVERFIGYLRRSFYVPLKTLLLQANIVIDKNTANGEVKKWLYQQANIRCHATTNKRPMDEWQIEKASLLPFTRPYLIPKELVIKNKLHLSPLLQENNNIQHDLNIYQQLLH